MKRKYGVMIATWILWFISVLVPLFCMVLQRVPQRFLTIQFLVILLLGILLCVQWIWLRRAERIQNTAVRGEIEGAGMAALQSMTVPMILAERDGKILWSNAIFQNRFVSGRSVLGRSVQDVIHLNLAALDQNRDLLMEHNGLSYRVHAVSSAQNQQEIIAVQFLEITDILRLQHEQTNSRPCVMLLVIDSYDDLLQYARESEKAQVSAEVERVLENFMQGTEIVSHWIGDNADQKSYTPDDSVERDGTLVMATNAEFPPYESVDGDTIVGVDVDMMQAVCDEIGMELKVENMEFDSIIAAVQSGKADVGVAGMTVTPDREENVSFTQGYATTTQVIIVRKD